jgi:hypothetical protein
MAFLAPIGAMAGRALLGRMAGKVGTMAASKAMGVVESPLFNSAIKAGASRGGSIGNAATRLGNFVEGNKPEIAAYAQHYGEKAAPYIGMYMGAKAVQNAGQTVGRAANFVAGGQGQQAPTANTSGAMY